MLGSGVNNFGFRGRICFNFIAHCFAYETNLDHCLNSQHITGIMPILCYFNSSVTNVLWCLSQHMSLLEMVVFLL